MLSIIKKEKRHEKILSVAAVSTAILCLSGLCLAQELTPATIDAVRGDAAANLFEGPFFVLSRFLNNAVMLPTVELAAQNSNEPTGKNHDIGQASGATI